MTVLRAPEPCPNCGEPAESWQGKCPSCGIRLEDAWRVVERLGQIHLSGDRKQLLIMFTEEPWIRRYQPLFRLCARTLETAEGGGPSVRTDTPPALAPTSLTSETGSTYEDFHFRLFDL